MTVPASSSHKGAVIGLALLAMASCSDPTPITPPPPVESPTISCPSNVAVEVVQASSAIVQYPAPIVGGGVAPVTSACSIPQGSVFQAGTTDVMCTATDSVAQRAQCGFKVTVTEIPRVKGTRFLAFGDSITCCEVAGPQIVPKVTDPDHSYAKVLEGMLRDRYKAQTIAFAVGSAGGEQTIKSEDRLRDAIAESRPEAVMLFQGTNDVNSGTDPAEVSQALRANIQRAKSGGAKIVFLSTLLPQIPDLPKAFNPEGVGPMNDMIRQVAIKEGAILVDNFAAIDPRKNVLIGDDGLHTTVEGSRVIAETFFAAIIANYEELKTPSGTTSIGRTRR